MMKFVVLAFALVLATVSAELYNAEQLTTMQGYSKECEASTHVEHAKITEMRHGHFEEDAHLKDYLACFFKKMGWMHDDGTMDKDHITKDLAKSKTASDAMEHCHDKHGSSASETAYVVFKCYKEHLPTDFKATL